MLVFLFGPSDAFTAAPQSGKVGGPAPYDAVDGFRRAGVGDAKAGDTLPGQGGELFIDGHQGEDVVEPNGKRIHFTSAMTMLGYSDGNTDGCSYLELAEWISRNSCQAQADLEELWKRLVFNIAISNCDDHLRNHGFLLSEKGWILAPAYDLNPTYYGLGLSLNIDEYSNALDFELALDVAPYFGINATKSVQIIASIKQHVSSWSTWAKHYHIPREDQELMSPAFKV